MKMIFILVRSALVLVLSLHLLGTTVQAQICPSNGLVYGINFTGANQLQARDAVTFALVRAYSMAPASFAAAINKTDGLFYYVTNNANVSNPNLFRLNLNTGAVSPSSCTLPSLSGGDYYISGGSDVSGNLYFITDHGKACYRINPTTSCAVTTLWSPANPVIEDPMRPSGVNFAGDFKNMVIDANGNLLIIDAFNHHLWLVNPNTRQATYRGYLQFTGTASDVYYANNGTLYASTMDYGVYRIDPVTLIGTSVSSYNTTEFVASPCEASVLPPMVTPPTCDSSIMYAVNGNSLIKINSTTFQPVSTYTLPFTTSSVAWSTNGIVYTVTSATGAVNPPVYGFNSSTGSVFNTGCTLPTLTGSGEYYISGAADASGNIYFVSDHGRTFVKHNPATCTNTILWQNTAITTSGAPPAGINFNSDFLDVTIDRNGDYYFVAENNRDLWQVRAGTTTAIYRGRFSGAVAGKTLTDIVFSGGNMYVTSSNGGVYLVNPVTLSTSLVSGTGSLNYSDAASSFCSTIPLEKDTDRDGVPDWKDIDDDNDGITDLNESGGYDPLADCDGDGIPNYLDPTPGCVTPAGNDPWGVPYKPLIWSDCNGDGINDFFDWDRDGIINELDLDSDNDGILDVQEARPNGIAVTSTLNGMITGTDADGNGLLSSYDNGNSNPVLNGIGAQDLDRDGTPNFLDMDSDGDGITDATEALGIYDTDGLANGTDTDGDGVRAENFGSNAASTADNINGFGAKGFTLLDTDGDGKPNAYDIDSDNDGITDNTEGQPTCTNKLPSMNDCDGDGVDDSYDIIGGCAACIRSSGGITPYDKDGDGTPDYLDTDTDNDGISDIYEATTIPDGNGGHTFPGPNYWMGAAGDADGDGLMDYFDGFNIKTETTNFPYNVITNNLGTNGVWATPNPTGSNAQVPESDGLGGCPGGGERDWRSSSMILPVVLAGFSGNLNGNAVLLSWAVTGEVNMLRYEVERSNDAMTYIKVATVNATGSSIAKTYTATDLIGNLSATTVYYKLKMIDRNGSVKYSNIIAFDRKKTMNTVSVHPNPASTHFTVTIKSGKETNSIIRITDILGKIIFTRNVKLLSGINVIPFTDIERLNNGVYSVLVLTDENAVIEKLLINR